LRKKSNIESLCQRAAAAAKAVAQNDAALGTPVALERTRNAKRDKGEPRFAFEGWLLRF